MASSEIKPKEASKASVTVLNTREIKQEMRRDLWKLQANAKEILKCTNATPIHRHNDLGYMCCHCFAQYRDPAALKSHNHEFHADKVKPVSPNVRNSNFEYCLKLDITYLQCKLCNSNIDNLESLLHHLQNEHGKVIYSDIKNQILPFKFDTAVLTCCICSRTFEKFKKLQEHMHTHYRNYICEVCDAGFVTYSSLEMHSNTHKIGTFNCDFCAKLFDTQSKKKSHEKSVHKPVKTMNRCGFCGQRFKCWRKKNQHLANAHSVVSHAVKCQACDKTFKDKSLLAIHTRRDHLMERSYKCSQCVMNFFTLRQLKRHTVKHTGSKDFRCEVCKKSFGRKYTLIEHMRIHDDDRRFKCEHCGQAFVQKCSWKGHMRTRHGEIV